MNAANLHGSSIAVNILNVYAYFIAPPHLQYFGKVVVHPSVSCIFQKMTASFAVSIVLHFRLFFPTNHV